LFRDFAGRAKAAFNCPNISAIYLDRNYRSTDTIVTFFNKFIKNDPDFHPSARVKPLKPEIKAESGLPPFPILGIFRDDSQDLADVVSDFLAAVFGAGYKIPGTDFELRKATNGGDFGDTVLLSKSVNEFGRPFMGIPPRPRFPYFLRLALEARGVRVFNPRGRPVRDVDAIRQLLGLILETIDQSSASFPSGEIAGGSSTFLRNDVKRVFGEWRQAARALLGSNPKALNGKSLQSQLGEMRNLAKFGGSGPRDWPLLDVIYAYIPFIPQLADDPEHQVYFEAVTRAAAQMVSFSGYRGLINRSLEHNVRSRRSAIYDMLSPLAEGDIDVDEEILVSPPRNCFNFMTIHQSKGLEYPMVLVDVSSEFKTDNAKQRFKRFPERASGTAQIEDAFAAYTEIGALRGQRTALQRSFEDIVREYYVAYSRPQSVLVLVGNRKALHTKTNIKHIGHFWRTNKSWAWADGLPTNKPPPIPDVPFQML
jgi:DNA helicase-2/ATP-dependent DNA helicase PcrA